MNLWIKLRLDAIVREVEKNEGISVSYTMNATEVLWHIKVKSNETQKAVVTVLPVDYKLATSPDMPKFILQTIEELQELEWSDD